MSVFHFVYPDLRVEIIFRNEERGVARILKKYLKISRKFLKLMKSQLMTSYRETNITKKKK